MVVVGDYDADGATATAVMLRTLTRAATALGSSSRIHYRIPDRFRDGHGLSPEAVRELAPFAPGLLVTVDTGTGSVEGVQAARALGFRVVITDHHLPGEKLPSAEGLVNPNVPEEPASAELRHLAGVGVAFYVALGLRDLLRRRGDERLGEALRPATLLDWVALGTVADVVPLSRNNRVLVEQGLRRIRAGETGPGLRALIRHAGRNPATLVTRDLAFAVAPRLNAAGRMENMGIGVECLLADAGTTAEPLAARLDELNRSRRALQAQMTEEALAAVEAAAEEQDGTMGPAVCVADAGWHEGIVGIVAARLRERFHRPVIAFAPAADTPGWKGSARSVDGLHMRDLIEGITLRAPALVERFGGHAMAAGLTLQEGALERFRELFQEAVEASRGAQGEDPATILTDGGLRGSEFSLEVAAALRYAAPWGRDFPEPLFDNRFRVLGVNRLDGGHLRLRLRLAEAAGGGAPEVSAIAFGGVERGWQEFAGLVRVVYRFELNEFQGRQELQLQVEHMESAQDEPVAGTDRVT